MRWIPFAILVYMAAVLQTAVAPYLALHGVWPDFLVIVALYYVLAAKAVDAMLACWIVGLVIDLTGLSYPGARAANVGAHALALGLISVPLVRLRDYVFRESVWTQLTFTFTAMFALAALAGLHMLYTTGHLDRIGTVLTRGAYEAAYTAVLAPYGHWLLRLFRGPLGVGAAPRWSVR